jgi:hypothetical protein
MVVATQMDGDFEKFRRKHLKMQPRAISDVKL